MAEEAFVTTDEAILDSIGEGDEPISGESVSDETSGEESNTTEEAPTTSSEQSAETVDESQQQGPTRGPQDFVDANGNVIAAGGKERRFYETAQREKSRADQATTKIAELEGQLKAINDAGNVGTQYNLSPDELTTGAQLIAAYKNNPVETIQYMLTQAQGSGHNVSNIVSGGTDMGAVKQMLDNALAPLIGDRQTAMETQAAQDEALKIYNDFSTQHPDAEVHENSLARLLQEEPSLNVDTAYYKLRNYYLEKGLDWTKSLETLQQEYDAAQSRAPNTQPQPPEGGINASNATDTARVADINTSTDDIIRQAMEEAGIN